MFSFCVDPGKAATSVDVRFIDNLKVSWFRFCRSERIQTELWVYGARSGCRGGSQPGVGLTLPGLRGTRRTGRTGTGARSKWNRFVWQRGSGSGSGSGVECVYSEVSEVRRERINIITRHWHQIIKCISLYVVGRREENTWFSLKRNNQYILVTKDIQLDGLISWSFKSNCFPVQ